MTDITSRKIKAFTFIFTLVMIVYHAQWAYFNDIALVRSIQPVIFRFYGCCGCVAMSFFFMTSGYLLYRNLDAHTTKEKLKRRIKSLLIPFVIWNIIYMPADILFHGREINGVAQILYGFSFSPYNGPLWYVFAIFLLSLLAVPMARIMRKKMLVFSICAVLAVVSVLVYGLEVLKYLGLSEETHIVMWIVRLFRYLPSYMLGCLWGGYNEGVLNRSIKRNTSRFWLAIMLILSCILLWTFVDDFPKIAKQFILIVLPVLIWLTIGNEPFQKPLRQFVKGSFMMYAMHFMIIFVVRFVLEKVLPVQTKGVPALIIWLLYPYLMVLCTYISSDLTIYILDKFNLTFLKGLLTGNRS